MPPVGSIVIYASMLIPGHVPERAVQSGIGFSQGVASAKSLQKTLAPNVIPHCNAGQDVKVADYGMEFHDTTTDGHTHTSSGRRRPHFHTGDSGGMRVGSGGPHEKIYDADCKRRYTGLI